MEENYSLDDKNDNEIDNESSNENINNFKIINDNIGKDINDINDILNVDNVRSKINYYYEIFFTLKDQISDMKKRVIIHYSNLTLINSTIHVSIITFTTISTFIQSIIQDNENNEIVKYITMSTTTYSGLILALSKFYKLEEKKETSHNLRDRFADLEGKVYMCIEMLRPWRDEEHYLTKHNGRDVKDKRTEWTSLIEKMDSEYMNIIEIKNELCTCYDKLFDDIKTIESIEKQFSRKNEKITMENKI